MKYAFDLISDLYQTEHEQFDFKYKQTSPFAIVAGNIANDDEILFLTLKHLSECYAQVFFIDGFFEHYNKWKIINNTKDSIEDICSMFNNVTNLNDRVIISEGVALVGTNGWWDYRFSPKVGFDDARAWHQKEYNLDQEDFDRILSIAAEDAGYLYHSISRLQKHGDVKKIVAVTNTVPQFALVEQNAKLSNLVQSSVLGNSMLEVVTRADTEQKISHWCHGGYSSGASSTYNNILYVSNPMRRFGKSQNIAYSPKRLNVI